MKYDLVIPVYSPEERGLDRLERQLKSLENSRTVWVRAFIIDGSPSESKGTKELCESFRELKYINYPQVIFNKSVLINIGIKESTSEYVVISDLDSIYSPRFMTEVAKVLEKIPEAFLLSISYYLPEKTKYKRFEEEAWWDKHRAVTNRGIDTACGGVQIARRAWWTKVRGFDERYVKLGAMDGDTLKRAKTDGLETIWLDRTGKTTLFHQWHEPTKWKSEDDMQWLAKNRELFYGDNSVKRNLRGWCGAGKYKYQGREMGHTKVLNRVLNVLGAERGESPDLVVGENITGAFCINQYSVAQERVREIFCNVFKYDLIDKPRRATSIHVFYLFGKLVFPRQKTLNKNVEVDLGRYASSQDVERIIEIMKKIPIDFCELELFRVNRKVYVGKICPNPDIYPLDQPGIMERKVLYKMYREMGKVIEAKMLKGKNTDFNPLLATDIPEGARKYLVKRISGQRVLDYGAGELVFLLSKYASEVDCVVNSPYEKEWVENGFKNFSIQNVKVVPHPVGEYDVLIIKDFAGSYNIKDTLTHLKPGGYIIIDNYKWFDMGGKFEMERRARQTVFNWPGIIFGSDFGGGGVIFKRKPR